MQLNANHPESQISRRRPHASAAFTLVELLTVIAIIAVLATLLASAVTSAKKSAYQARCISNLHQVSLAMDMYLDDHQKRSENLGSLTSSRYLPERGVLLCPADKTRNWGGLVEPSSFFNLPSLANLDEAGDPTGAAPISTGKSAATGDMAASLADVGANSVVPRSYITPLPWDDDSWNKLMRAGGSAGIAVCQLHGLGRPDPDAPSIRDYQGLILRAQRDGAVVKRKMFWDSQISLSTPSFAAGLSAPASAMRLGSGDHPWKFFTDDPEASTP